MIYLASPFSHKNKGVKAHRAYLAMQASAQLLKLGIMAYSPIASWYNTAKIFELDGSYKYWQQHDEAMIDLCERFIILQIEGWRESNGVAKETRYARLQNRLIEGIDYKRLVIAKQFEPNLIGEWIWSEENS